MSMVDSTSITTRWLPIPGYEKIYEISTEGEVRSLPRKVYCRSRSGKVFVNSKPGMAMRGILTAKGYLEIKMGCGKGKGRRVGIHRLVLLAFVGPCPEGMSACHNDGNPANNRLENLRWDTPKNNSADMIRHGRSQRGAKQRNVKLTAEIVRKCRILYKLKLRTIVQLSKCYGVDHKTMTCALDGRSWAWIST